MRTEATLAVLLAACGPTGEGSAGDGTDDSATRGDASSTSPTTVTTSGASATEPLPSTDTTTASPTETTVSTTVGSATGDDTLDSASATFIVMPDGGATDRCFCSIWDQDCPVGDKCVPWASDGGPTWDCVRCVPVARDPVAPGGVCSVEAPATSGFDDCDATSICWDVDSDTLQGVCVQQCTGSEDNPVCPDGAFCLMANQGVLALCIPNCDPLGTDCDAGEVCAQVGGGLMCVPDIEDGGYLDPCAEIASCDPGLVCAAADQLAGLCEPDSGGCCTSYCDTTIVNPDAQCPDQSAGQVCSPLYPDGAPDGLEHVGVCIVP